MEARNISNTKIAQNEIAARAYQIWESHGRPAGRELEHWLQAEKELRSAKGGPSSDRPEPGRRSEQPSRSAPPSRTPSRGARQQALAA